MTSPEKSAAQFKAAPEGDAVTLARTTIVGFSDLSGAGPRVLSSLLPSGGMFSSGRVQWGSVELPGVEDIAFLKRNSQKKERKMSADGRTWRPIEVANIYFDKKGTPPSYSLLIINAVIAPDTASLVAKAIVSYIEGVGMTEEIIVAAAVRFKPSPAVKNAKLVHYLPLNGSTLRIDTSAPRVAGTVSDPFMNSLLFFLQVRKLRATCLFVQGLRANNSSEDDGTSEIVATLGKAVAMMTKLKYSSEKTAPLSPSSSRGSIVDESAMYT